ncbi:MAG TPA: DUF294 nucleotidyltransferase-like domain-containing protein [Anaerolineaceae bacterium]
MNAGSTILVNFHLHSIYSYDGEMDLDLLTEKLGAAGVQYAALTDHDSIDGLPRFQEALQRRGIGYISGVELSTQHAGREIHLLGYGFDPAHPGLQESLVSLRQGRDLGVHSITSSLINLGRSPNGTSQVSEGNQPRDGKIDTIDAINLLHAAGGLAFLAHPLVYDTLDAPLANLVQELKNQGLDGLEVYYTAFSETDREKCRSLAQANGLIPSAGTDAHHTGHEAGIEMPFEAWKQLRQGLITTRSFTEQPLVSAAQANKSASSQPERHGKRWALRNFGLRILFPTLLAIILFVAALWGLILPSVERTLLDRKREMIQELTNSAWSILVSYERDERSGALTRTQAQEMAISRIAALRYGREGKDYFWLQDMQPRIIMHPYRTDLNGQDVSNFTDPRGVRIFVAFADLVRRQNEGYIEYVWQWKDDPERLEPKESYVKGFQPWGWIIGTGLYIDDVNAEIARIERSLVLTSLGISAIVVFLLLFALQQSLRIERERYEADASLRESNERYRSLVEATTEGTLLILAGRCRYANPILLQMLGYSPRQLELLSLSDVLPPEGNQAAWQQVHQAEIHQEVEGVPGFLQGAGSRQVECVLTVNPITIEGSSGIILIAKAINLQAGSPAQKAEYSYELAQAAWAVPAGIFRARAARRGVFLEINQAGRRWLAGAAPSGDSQPALADLFADSAQFDEFMALLQRDKIVDNFTLRLKTIHAETYTLLLSARLILDEHNAPAYIDGFFQDLTAAQKLENEKDTLIERLQTSLLFLQEPVSHLGRNLVTLGLETSIQKAAAVMTARGASAAIVETENGVAIGMITDHDLRERALAEGLDLHTPVRMIMSAPMVTIDENALIFEALMRMEEKGVQHLAVVSENRKIVNILRYKEMIQFYRYGSQVIVNEIARADSVDAVVQSCKRLPLLAAALVNSGAQPRSITRMISQACDSATVKFIELAIAEIGKPPLPFAFVATGSHGRQEQTLLTDQDSAIIYSDPASAALQEQAAAYFPLLGKRVSEGLNQAGFPLCQGQMMASNPLWCRSLSTWKREFSDWIRKAEPQELLDFSIFFDFRIVYGISELPTALRLHIHDAIQDYPPFFIHFARNSLSYTPPTRLFGRIYLGGGSMEHEGLLNLKDAMMPVVSFARLYALRHRIHATHTLDRIHTLVEKEILLPSSADEITTIYDFLMRLRLQHQVDALAAGRTLDNSIQPARLGHSDAALLQQAFAQIAAIQKKISYDFLGGT